MNDANSKHTPEAVEAFITELCHTPTLPRSDPQGHRC
jgi:hypothetical protein